MWDGASFAAKEECRDARRPRLLEPSDPFSSPFRLDIL